MPYKNIEDKRKARMRSYYNNREKELNERKEYEKEYRHTYGYKKTHTISNWKRSGLIETDYYTYDELFDAYYYQGYCESCNKDFLNITDRCMDHDHKTQIFRNIVCQRCNVLRRYIDAKTIQ